MAHPAEAMPGMPAHLHDGGDRAGGEDGDGVRNADAYFRSDARRLGYLQRGGGGIVAYYRDMGMSPPEGSTRQSRREITNWKFYEEENLGFYGERGDE